MSAIIPESDLRAREQELLAQLNERPRHSLETIFEAMSLGLAMGSSQIETTLLQDQKTVDAVRVATSQKTYPALIRDGAVRFIIPKLEAALRTPSLEVDTDEVKQLWLAAAVLGNLRGRRKLG